VVAAATDEFAEVGIAGVTVREIATRAGVNPGLVHRYVGSKADLLLLVMDRAGAELAADLRAAGGVDSAFLSQSTDNRVARYERLVAHLVLEGHSLEVPGREYPLMDYVVDQTMAGAGLDERAARLRAASIVALDMGWRLFEPLVAAATHLEEDDLDQVAESLGRARQDLASRP